ncbi:MFS general substrate transporter [Crepidotus variabilis]|uniref:MFS general substrate transporter n=1 Tax=Crepidotus variabilis TaxID=179855 RepID=A0A9P6JTW0_9AGAR|nr:MFS general substrate transporter [Crepidotus variabilis]
MPEETSGPASAESACDSRISCTKDEYESPQEEDYPDGGLRAWLVVAGAMCNSFATFGYANSWGVFQSYYQEELLIHTSPSSIAWIGSIQYALMFLPGLIVGRLFDQGYLRAVYLPSSAVIVIATFLVAECKEYWHFLLCQGIAIGLASSGVFSSTPAIIAHWFKKRRGVAISFYAIGVSLGGTILPIVARFLIASVGFRWAMRTFGFILMVALGMSNLLLRRRLPPGKVEGGLVNLTAFKYAPYSFYCLSGLIIFLGLYTLLTYVAVTAVSIGISQEFAFYFVAIANASSLAGRFMGGVACDRLGAMNTMIPTTIASAAITYGWPYARTKGSLIAVTVLYGYFSGIYISLTTLPLMAMGETADVGRRIGMFFSIMAVGSLAGPPISGAISSGPGGFAAVGFYAGSCMLVGVGLITVSRYLILGRWMGKI